MHISNQSTQNTVYFDFALLPQPLQSFLDIIIPKNRAKEPTVPHKPVPDILVLFIDQASKDLPEDTWDFGVFPIHEFHDSHTTTHPIPDISCNALALANLYLSPVPFHPSTLKTMQILFFVYQIMQKPQSIGCKILYWIWDYIPDCAVFDVNEKLWESCMAE